MVLIPATFAQANLKFSGPGLPTGAEITLGLNVGSFAGTPAAAAGQVVAAWALGPASVQVNTVELTEVLVKYGPTATGPSGVQVAALPGSLSVNGTSPAVALLVQKLTLAGGRAGRGRCYMPGMTEADTSVAGVVDGAYLAAAQDAWDDFYDKLVVEDLLPALLHGADSPLLTPTQIESFAVTGTVATQRRRQRR